MLTSIYEAVPAVAPSSPPGVVTPLDGSPSRLVPASPTATVGCGRGWRSRPGPPTAPP